MNTLHRWHLQGSTAHAYSGEEARRLVGNRFDWASQETWFEDEQGRLLAVVTNGERAMVTLMHGAGDPGEHLIDPGAEGSSDGYLLSNGQSDTYADRDTVPFGVAARAVAHVIDHGGWPEDVTVEDDREG
ncbi:hypothetical protein [Kitasatospora viridis]|uniref:Uncharacterized protein n=1 Tax=Kitasatospora viridis TaxID=281105 RepID=A0A561T6Y6_9ACTN|nr:hypothetical protein [Kitasatospora viridis]TWF82886.1 hypothetical protein FHX73_14368 [Kitasatospora viridis]